MSLISFKIIFQCVSWRDKLASSAKNRLNTETNVQCMLTIHENNVSPSAWKRHNNQTNYEEKGPDEAVHALHPEQEVLEVLVHRCTYMLHFGFMLGVFYVVFVYILCIYIEKECKRIFDFPGIFLVK